MNEILRYRFTGNSELVYLLWNHLDITPRIIRTSNRITALILLMIIMKEILASC